MTYKHVWFIDDKSGEVFIKNRKRAPLDFLARHMTRFRILSNDRNIEKNPVVFYEGDSPLGQKFLSREDIEVQVKRAQDFWNFFRQNGLDLSGKSILDVSGGNGVFARTLLNLGAKRVQITELSPAAVDYAKNELGLEAKVCDLNLHHLTDLLRGGGSYLTLSC